MKQGEEYTFKQLEKFIADHKECIALRVFNESVSERAIMHIFYGNFCGDWLSGDGVLFYESREVHSAEPEDKFIFQKIIHT